jgi:hypothetical protein
LCEPLPGWLPGAGAWGAVGRAVWLEVLLAPLLCVVDVAALATAVAPPASAPEAARASSTFLRRLMITSFRSSGVVATMTRRCRIVVRENEELEKRRWPPTSQP